MPEHAKRAGACLKMPENAKNMQKMPEHAKNMPDHAILVHKKHKNSAVRPQNCEMASEMALDGNKQMLSTIYGWL